MQIYYSGCCSYSQWLINAPQLDDQHLVALHIDIVIIEWISDWLAVSHSKALGIEYASAPRSLLIWNSNPFAPLAQAIVDIKEHILIIPVALTPSIRGLQDQPNLLFW